jgi:O-antigen/teichoic acid export membrane protein
MVLGLRLFAQAGTLLLVARLLGPHDFGAFAGVAALAVMLGTLSTFGTHIVLLAAVSRAPRSRDDVLPFAISTTLICGSLLLAVYLTVAMNLLRDTGVAAAVLVAIGLTELILQPLLNLVTAEHQGRERIALSQLLISLPTVLRLLVAIAVWLMHFAYPLLAYAWGYVGASMLALLVAKLSMDQAWPAPHQWRLPRKTELRHAAGFAVLNLTAASPTEIDKTLALRFLPLSTAGVYAAGARIIGAMTLPVIAMMLSAMPRLFREHQTGEHPDRRLLLWVFVAALAYSLVMATALWIAAPLFDRLFGDRYVNIGNTIRWLTLAVPAMALRISAGTVLMAMGHPWMRVTFEVTGLATLTLAATALTAHWGLHGLALALACSEWAMALLGTTFIFRSS